MVDINITDSAISKIQEVLKKQDKTFFRIKVKGGGCSGFQYIFKTDSEYSEEKDNIYKLKEIDIVIDKKSDLDKKFRFYKDINIKSQTLIYICKDNSCSLPFTNVKSLKKYL